MKLRRSSQAALGALVLWGVTAGLVQACTAEQMARTEDGFLRKVVAGSDKITAQSAPAGGETVFTLELMKPYYPTFSK